VGEREKERERALSRNTETMEIAPLFSPFLSLSSKQSKTEKERV
jgi:hypothetical protein